jgi:chromate reductase
MPGKKNIFIINGSASSDSANHKLIHILQRLTNEAFEMTLCCDLKTLPHFDPELSSNNPPEKIIELRNHIQQADGIIICTPEYVFSIPSGLKNAIEWCIATTLFMDKPTGLITASASGKKAHEELQIIMQTAMAKFTDDTTLLIPGIKGKFDELGNLKDEETSERIGKFITAFIDLVKSR